MRPEYPANYRRRTWYELGTRIWTHKNYYSRQMENGPMYEISSSFLARIEGSTPSASSKNIIGYETASLRRLFKTGRSCAALTTRRRTKATIRAPCRVRVCWHRGWPSHTRPIRIPSAIESDWVCPTKTTRRLD